MAELTRLIENNYNRPLKCTECGSTKIDYKGTGEYRCTSCGKIMYDDYGIVRNYLEKNPGATQSQVSRETGVPKNRISQMLKDDKIEISPGSMVFMFCENCGIEIRSGRLCIKCEADMLKKNASIKHASNIVGGFTKNKRENHGAMRFK